MHLKEKQLTAPQTQTMAAMPCVPSATAAMRSTPRTAATLQQIRKRAVIQPTRRAAATLQQIRKRAAMQPIPRAAALQLRTLWGPATRLVPNRQRVVPLRTQAPAAGMRMRAVRRRLPMLQRRLQRSLSRSTRCASASSSMHAVSGVDVLLMRSLMPSGLRRYLQDFEHSFRTSQAVGDPYPTLVCRKSRLQIA